MAVTVEDIAKGIHQAALHGMDLNRDIDPSGEDVGLQRDEGDKIQDSRVMDGFKVKINANIMTIYYQSECNLEEVHSNNFETDVKRRVNQVAKFLKKEYKRLTENTLNISERGDIDIRVQNRSRYHTWIQAQQQYEISGIEGIDNNQTDREEIANDLEIGFT